MSASVGTLKPNVRQDHIPQGVQGHLAHGPMVGSSSTAKMAGACGSDDCAAGGVLKDDGSGARKLFHSS